MKRVEGAGEVVNEVALGELVAALRHLGAETTSVEAKRAEGGLPKSVRETLSAFSNTPGGGVVVLGLDEMAGFTVVGVSDPRKLLSDLSAVCRDDIVPPLRPELFVGVIEGKHVVTAEVPELPRQQKPCYCRSLGVDRGSFIRVGESDRRLTFEDVQQLVADRGQPVFDHEIVPDGVVDDLEPEMLRDYVERMRKGSPRVFGNASPDVIMRMTKIVVKDAQGVDRLTLAGLLALGKYSQQYFPQLNMTFVHYPTPSGETTPGGVRFLDNVSFNGPIPYMTLDALAAIQRNMSRRALVVGGGRRDIWEYPPEALREAIVNGLVHRDLSPGSRGNQVQIEMYPDRLRIVNPGGLFGAIDITRLGEEGRSSARNGLLMKILEDVVVPGDNQTVCENRGSGIRSMISALRHAGMSPPKFRDRTTSFEVEIPNYALLDDDTVEWLNALGREGLRDTQCTGLALMWRGEVLDNARYRVATGVSDSRVVTFELQDLVARELVTQTGTRGGARYTLSDYAHHVTERDGRRRARPNRRRQIIDLLALHGELSKTEIGSFLSLNPKTTEHWLRTLRTEGAVTPTAPSRSKNTRYRLTAQGMRPSLPLDS